MVDVDIRVSITVFLNLSVTLETPPPQIISDIDIKYLECSIKYK